MRLAFDARLSGYRRGGIATYSEQLLRQLTLQLPDGELIVLDARRRRTGRLHRPLPMKSVRVFTPPHHRLEQLTLPLEIAAHRPQLVHSPDFIPSFVRNWRAVITVHDLAFVRFPELLTKTSARYYGQIRRACQSADQIIAVSQNTADDLIQLLNVPARKVAVIHEAAAELYRRLPEEERQAERARRGVPQGYHLFVSTIEPRKNLSLLFEVYASVGASELLPLLVVGDEGWLSAPIMEEYRQLQLGERVRFLGAAGQDELVRLYNGATSFVYPSRYEGFGLPPLEAMACGVPVLAADNSSLPEVVGEAGILLPATDPAAWLSAMLAVQSEAGLHDQMSQAGLSQAARFSWNRAAEETLALYRRVIGGRR